MGISCQQNEKAVSLFGYCLFCALKLLSGWEKQLKAMTLAIIFASLVSYVSVSTPDGVAQSPVAIHAEATEAFEDSDAVMQEPPALPSDPDDDEDEDRVHPSRKSVNRHD